jgi:hypothetical protein
LAVAGLGGATEELFGGAASPKFPRALSRI